MSDRDDKPPESRDEWVDWLRNASKGMWLQRADEILLALADERRKAREECAKEVENSRETCGHYSTHHLFTRALAKRIRSLPASGTEREPEECGHNASIHDSKVHAADADKCWCKPKEKP